MIIKLWSSYEEMRVLSSRSKSGNPLDAFGCRRFAPFVAKRKDNNNKNKDKKNKVKDKDKDDSKRKLSLSSLKIFNFLFWTQILRLLCKENGFLPPWGSPDLHYIRRWLDLRLYIRLLYTTIYSFPSVALGSLLIYLPICLPNLVCVLTNLLDFCSADLNLLLI